MMAAVGNILETLRSLLGYIRDYKWMLLFMIVASYHVLTNHVGPFVQEQQRRRDDSNDPQRAAQLKEEMKRIRLQQQQDTSHSTAEAEKIRKEKEREEKRKKAEKVVHENLKGGHVLGKGSGDDGTTRAYPKPPNNRNSSTRLPPQPLQRGRGNTHTLADIAPDGGSTTTQTQNGTTGSGGSNWNTEGTRFMTPDDRWAQAELGARRRRHGGPRFSPGNAPSSRGKWGR